MTTTRYVTYVIPAHNEQAILEQSVAALRTALAQRGPDLCCLILIVENGSSDDTAAIAERLAAASAGAVKSFREPLAGMGHALHRGVQEGLALVPREHDEDHWLILTAADLPFALSDLDQLLARLPPAVPAGSGRPSLAIGSKAHPQSVVRTSLLRRTMTGGYRVLRRLLLNMSTGDPQGSILIRADLARVIAPGVAARDYFYTTELVYRAERSGAPPVELPVTLVASRRPSKVRPLRDSLRMLRGVLQLRAHQRPRSSSSSS